MPQSVTGAVYADGAKYCFSGAVWGGWDLNGSKIKCMLLKKAYFDGNGGNHSGPAQDTEVYTDVQAFEISNSGTNYTAGGVAMNTNSISVTSAGNITKLIAGTTTFPLITYSDVRGCCIYSISPADANVKKVLGYIDFLSNAGDTYSPSAQDIVITWDATGAMQLIYV